MFSMQFKAFLFSRTWFMALSDFDLLLVAYFMLHHTFQMLPLALRKMHLPQQK